MFMFRMRIACREDNTLTMDGAIQVLCLLGIYPDPTRERSKCLGSGDLIIRHFFTLCKQGGGTDAMITCLIAPIPSGDRCIHITLLHCLIAEACDA